jgi:uncharacterized BrkB/YihY/UPF0761 family membrane protein
MARDRNFAKIRTQLSTFVWKIINDWSFSLAALIAYNLLISLLPLILCLFSATILIFGNDPYFLNVTRERLTESVHQQSFNEIVNMLSESVGNQATIVLLMTFVVAVFAGSRLFIGIDDVLTIIYRIRERRVIDQNIHAIKMLLVFITLLPIVIISSSAIALLKENHKFYYFIITFLSGGFTFVLFSSIYYFVPNRDMHWSKMFVENILRKINRLTFSFLVGVDHYLLQLVYNFSLLFFQFMFNYF